MQANFFESASHGKFEKESMSTKAPVSLNGILIGLAAIASCLTCFIAAISVAPKPAAAQTESLKLLGSLSKGEWTLKHRDGSRDSKICIRTGQELIQLRHAEFDCSRFVVEDNRNKVTVQYTCPGNGYGRTDIRKETGGLVQIESQGIASGTLFQFAAEARHTGRC